MNETGIEGIKTEQRGEDNGEQVVALVIEDIRNGGPMVDAVKAAANS